MLRKQLRRAQLAEFFANLPACLIGMEACASAHHWGRTLERLGHTVRLMAPQFVKPYVKTNKNDAADAAASCAAVTRPSRRFVPSKNLEQQALLSVHRVRQGLVKARTAQANQLRGLLGEFALVIAQGISNVTRCIPELLEAARNELPMPFRELSDRLAEHLKELERQVKDLEQQSILWIATTSTAVSFRRYRGWARLLPAPWSPRSPMRAASITAGKSPLGWASFRVKAPAAASRCCWE